MENYVDEFHGLIFDLDGTLYKNCALDRLYDQCFMQFIATYIGVNSDRIPAAINRTCQALGSIVDSQISQVSLLPALGIPLKAWYSHSCDAIDPRDYLQPAAQLRTLFKQLRQSRQLGVISNNCSIQIDRTLRALNIQDLISWVASPNTADELKPSPRMFMKALDRMQLAPRKVLAVGDRYFIDIAPAERIGIRGMLVLSPDELVEKLAELSDSIPQ